MMATWPTTKMSADLENVGQHHSLQNRFVSALKRLISMKLSPKLCNWRCRRKRYISQRVLYQLLSNRLEANVLHE